MVLPFKKNNPGCPCCGGAGGIPECPNCDCTYAPASSAEAIANYSPCSDCPPGESNVLYAVCITEAITPCGSPNAPQGTIPPVNTKVFIEGYAGCRWLYSEAGSGTTPGLRVRLFAPSTGVPSGKWDLDIYYPFGGSHPWDFYFHAEIEDFNCNGCNTIDNQVTISDCGGQGKGEFDTPAYKTRGYGGKVEMTPCRKSP